MVAGLLNGLFTVEAEDGVLLFINCLPVVRAVFLFSTVIHCNNAGIKGQFAFFANAGVFAAVNMQTGAHNCIAVRADVSVLGALINQFKLFTVHRAN